MYGTTKTKLASVGTGLFRMAVGVSERNCSAASIAAGQLHRLEESDYPCDYKLFFHLFGFDNKTRANLSSGQPRRCKYGRH